VAFWPWLIEPEEQVRQPEAPVAFWYKPGVHERHIEKPVEIA
jgi:hypothetical protein